MMKNAGFKPEFAAGTEASASTGGQIMPPIMGAAAFIMMEYLGVSYAYIMAAAVFHATMYFLRIFIVRHFTGTRLCILGLRPSMMTRLILIQNSYGDMSIL